MKIKGLFKNKKPSKEKLKSKFKFKKLICGYAIINNKKKRGAKLRLDSSIQIQNRFSLEVQLVFEKALLHINRQQ